MRRARAATVLAAALWPGAALAFLPLGPVWDDGRGPMFFGALDDSAFEAAFVDAAGDWEDASDFDFLLNPDDQPACDRNVFGVGEELELGAEFGDRDCDGAFLGDDVLAVTMIDSSGGRYEAAGMIFNDALDWTVYDGLWDPDEPDFRRVALHELGHWLGLDHENGEAAIMQSFASSIDSLQADDVQGARFLYGPGDPGGPTLPPVLPPDVVCRRAQLSAAGALCKKQLACRARAIERPDKDPLGTVRDLCLAKARDGAASRFAAAVAAGGCEFTGPDATLLDPVDDAALAIADAVAAGVDAANRADTALRGKLARQGGAACKSAFAAETRFAKHGRAARRADERADVTDAFVRRATAAIGRAAAKGIVYDGAAPADVADPIDTLVDDAAATAGN